MYSEIIAINIDADIVHIYTEYSKQFHTKTCTNYGLLINVASPME